MKQSAARSLRPAAEAMPRSVLEPVPTPENYVCTARINVLLSLVSVITALKPFGAEYNPKKFAAVILKLGNDRLSPRATLLVFAAGKIVCTGSKCEASALLCITRLIQWLRELCGYHSCEMTRFEVQNVVGCLRLGFEMNPQVAAFDPQHGLVGASYEPESFPGVIYSYNDIVYLLFEKGNIVITGGTTWSQIETAAKYIAPRVWQCRRIEGVSAQSAIIFSIRNNAATMQDMLTRMQRPASPAKRTRQPLSASTELVTALQQMSPPSAASSSSGTVVPRQQQTDEWQDMPDV